MTVFSFQLLVFALIAVERCLGWGYSQTDGPSTWAATYNKCGLLRQSPIDLTSAQYKNYDDFIFTGWDNILAGATIENNGHTVQVTVSAVATVKGGGLGVTYQVAQFHFHWGSVNTQGSEHRVDGASYPLEVHVVMFNNKYSDLTAAKTIPSGIAVFSRIFQVGTTDSVLAEVLNYLPQVTEPDVTVDVSGTTFSLGYWIPSVEAFYRYDGSLTTPTCDQTVIWTIFKEPLTVSADTLAQFRALKNHEGEALVDNTRPLQNLNTRILYKNFVDQ